MNNNIIVISSEEEALQYLENPENSIDSISIVKWDDWSVKITGNKYNGTIDTHLLRALLELQTSIYKFYAYLNYSVLNTNNLTQEQRKRLKLNILVKKGSTDINVELSDIIKHIFSTMPENYTLYTITTAIVLFFGKQFFQLWLDHKKDKEKSNSELEKDKSHFSLLEKLSSDNNENIKHITNIANQTHENILKHLKNTNASSIEYRNETLNPDRIKEILKINKVAREYKTLRLDGVYQILTINYEKETYIEFKLIVVDVPNLNNEQMITAFYNKDMVAKDDNTLFKLVENRNFYIEINGTMLDGVLEEAAIFSIKERKE